MSSTEVERQAGEERSLATALAECTTHDLDRRVDARRRMSPPRELQPEKKPFIVVAKTRSALELRETSIDNYNDLLWVEVCSNAKTRENAYVFAWADERSYTRDGQQLYGHLKLEHVIEVYHGHLNGIGMHRRSWLERLGVSRLWAALATTALFFTHLGTISTGLESLVGTPKVVLRAAKPQHMAVEGQRAVVELTARNAATANCRLEFGRPMVEPKDAADVGAPSPRTEENVKPDGMVSLQIPCIPSGANTFTLTVPVTATSGVFRQSKSFNGHVTVEVWPAEPKTVSYEVTEPQDRGRLCYVKVRVRSGSAHPKGRIAVATLNAAEDATFATVNFTASEPILTTSAPGSLPAERTVKYRWETPEIPAMREVQFLVGLEGKKPDRTREEWKRLIERPVGESGKPAFAVEFFPTRRKVEP